MAARLVCRRSSSQAAFVALLATVLLLFFGTCTTNAVMNASNDILPYMLRGIDHLSVVIPDLDGSAKIRYLMNYMRNEGVISQKDFRLMAKRLTEQRLFLQDKMIGYKILDFKEIVKGADFKDFVTKVKTKISSEFGGRVIVRIPIMQE
ncbi:hypothetical protein AKJ16_DCAP24577 [Drosera capensis]